VDSAQQEQDVEWERRWGPSRLTFIQVSIYLLTFFFGKPNVPSVISVT